MNFICVVETSWGSISNPAASFSEAIRIANDWLEITTPYSIKNITIFSKLENKIVAKMRVMK